MSISRLSLIATLLSICAAAQTAAPQPKPDYSHEAIVIEQLRLFMRFENDGTGERRETMRVRVQTEAGVQGMGVLRFLYDKATQDIQIGYVRLRKPDGSVVETPLSTIQDLPADVTRDAPMYSDLREKHVNVASLRPGDILESDVTTRIKASLVPGQFWFDADMERNAITLSQEIVLDVPADRALKLKVAPELKTGSRTENSRKIYTWTSANLEHKDSDLQRNKNQVQTAEEQSAPPAIQATTFQSWDELGRWFSDVQRDRVAPTADIKSKTAELARGLGSDEAKAQAIYDFVSEEIRYIGLEFGIGRYQANPASSVLANRYGDCKDKHTLLAAMLQAAGLKASPVLISTTRKLDPDIPSPSQFNHLISALRLGNRRVFLDTTAEVAPFGMLINPLRNRQALIVGTDGSTEIVRTPVDLPFQQFQKLEAEGKVDDKGNVSAEITQTFRGDLELLLRLAFRHSGADKFRDITQGIAGLTGYAGQVSNVTTSDLENTRVPLQIKYHYTRGDYLTWNGDTGTAKILVPGISLPASDAGADAKNEPIKLGPPIEIKYEGKLEFPREIRISEPRNVDMSREYADYHSTYKSEGSTVTVTRTLRVKTPEVVPAKRSDYAEFAKAVVTDGWQEAGASRGSVVASKQATGSRVAPKASENHDAQAAYEEGGRALMRGDFLTARSRYQEAVRLDPRHPDAWAELARLEMMSNNSDEALRALRKQLEVNPEHPEANMMVASVLMFRGDNQGAISALKNQIAVSPDDTRAYSRLASLYLADKKYKEALPVLEKAVGIAPDDSDLTVNLGNAYLETGANAKAIAAYEKVLAGKPTASMMNSIAYMLADHGVEVEHALELSKRAASRLESALSSAELEKLSLEDIRNTNILLATWDTVGWAYYKHGDLEKAKSYLVASWTTMQDRIVADHLATVYDRLGMKAQADEFRSYVRAMPQPRRIAIRDGQTIAVTQPGAPSVIGSGNISQRLQEMRTVPLSRRLKATEHAEFFVLLSPTGVEDVSFINGSEVLKPWTETLKKAKFPVSFPAGAGGKLVRRGILSCNAYDAKCIFVLYEPNQANLLR